MPCPTGKYHTKWQDASTTFWFHPQNKTAIWGTQSFRQQCLPNFFAINFSAAESAISLIKSALRLNIKAPLIFRLFHVNAPVFSLNCIAEGACKLQVDHLPNHFGAAEIKKATEAVLGSAYSNQPSSVTNLQQAHQKLAAEPYLDKWRPRLDIIQPAKRFGIGHGHGSNRGPVRLGYWILRF